MQEILHIKLSAVSHTKPMIRYSSLSILYTSWLHVQGMKWLESHHDIGISPMRTHKPLKYLVLIRSNEANETDDETNEENEDLVPL